MRGNPTVLLVLLPALVTPITAHAQDAPRDEVVLRSPSGGRVIQTGTIEDFTGRELILRTSETAAPRTFDAADVISVRTPRLPNHAAGLAAFEVGEYVTAARSLELAVDAEPRRWVRRDILALLVRCALATGDGRTARVRYQLLLESDPHNRHRHLIPLAWAPREIDAATASEARTLLVHELDAMRLVGASLLLKHAPNAAEAERVVRGISISAADDEVRHLAAAQLWRLRLGQTLSDHEVERWRADVDRLPAEYRAGPNYVLGRGWTERDRHDRAAIAHLWAPLVAGHDHELAARSLVAAGDSLRRIGQVQQAFGLYREVLARYGHTPFAGDARAAIEELNHPTDEREIP